MAEVSNLSPFPGRFDFLQYWRNKIWLCHKMPIFLALLHGECFNTAALLAHYSLGENSGVARFP